jgi:hypothetical protein
MKMLKLTLSEVSTQTNVTNHRPSHPPNLVFCGRPDFLPGPVFSHLRQDLLYHSPSSFSVKVDQTHPATPLPTCSQSDSHVFYQLDSNGVLTSRCRWKLCTGTKESMLLAHIACQIRESDQQRRFDADSSLLHGRLTDTTSTSNVDCDEASG